MSVKGEYEETFWLFSVISSRNQYNYYIAEKPYGFQNINANF